MIAISASIEPALAQLPVAAPASEPFQPYETEDDREVSGFEEILAGLLQNNEKSQEVQHDISDAEINVSCLFTEELNVERAPNLLAGVQDIPDMEFEGIEIPEEYLSVLLSTQQLLEINNIETAVDTDAVDLQTDLPNIEAAIPFGAEIAADLPVKEPNEVFVSQTAAALTAGAAETENMKNAQEISQSGDRENFFNERTFNELASKERVNGASYENENNEKIPAKFSRSEDLSLLQKESVNENANRSDERSQSRSRRDRIAFEVRDMRTGEANRNNSVTSSFAAVETATGRSSDNAPVREITLELRLPDNSAPSGQNAQTTWEAKTAGTGNIMENLLARELHQNFNGDIVRHASMILHDKGEGTIRLALKPESLGNVKIHLEMSENKITGQIFVESEEALNAFRKEIASLEQAFRDSGFTNADLNLSLSWNGQNANGQEQKADAWTPWTIASLYDNSVEGSALNIIDVFVERNSGSINMFA